MIKIHLSSYVTDLYFFRFCRDIIHLLPPQGRVGPGHREREEQEGGRAVWGIAIALQLTFVVIISIGLCKLQGQVVTHFEKVVWWKSFMVDFKLCNHL